MTPSFDAGDTIIEAANGGTDTVFSAISFTLPVNANVENLSLINGRNEDTNGTGNDLNNTITGTNFKNTLNGGTGNDILNGDENNDILFRGDGNDILNGGAGDDFIGSVIVGGPEEFGNDSLNGGEGNDIFNGGEGNDFLNGGGGDDVLAEGGGSDSLNGGVGNDRYFILESGDSVIEAANGGIDTVISSISFTMGTNLENLILNDFAGDK